MLGRYESIAMIVIGLLLIVGEVALGSKGTALAGAILAAVAPVSSIRYYCRFLNSRMIKNWTIDQIVQFDGNRLELERSDGFRVAIPLESAQDIHTDEHWITVRMDEFSQIVAPSSAFNKEEFRMIALACREAKEGGA